MVDLNRHELDHRILFECFRNLPANQIFSTNSTEKTLSLNGPSKDQLIDSLQAQGFQPYQHVKNFSLLLLFFQSSQQQNYIRIINYLSKQVETVELPSNQLSCKRLLAEAKLLSIDSHPPFADVYIDDRMIGEAPLWTSLDEGLYEVQCKLPDDAFPKTTLRMPGTTELLCSRENQSTTNMENRKTSASEKTESWFLYGLIAAISAGGIILPFLIF